MFDVALTMSFRPLGEIQTGGLCPETANVIPVRRLVRFLVDALTRNDNGFKIVGEMVDRMYIRGILTILCSLSSVELYESTGV
jgi:hypothetical protein